jgi:hypothetical protein
VRLVVCRQSCESIERFADFVQNDEYELLSDWLQYHAYMFGIPNLHVVDHNSKDVRVCRVRALYKLCGMRFTHHGGGFDKRAIY